MRLKQLGISVFGAAILIWAGAAQATVFFTDPFSYADGQLTAADSTNAVGTGANVSGGNWVNHSGLNGNFIQVVSGQAELLQPGAEDANRDTGSTLAYGGSTWYYGLQFTVTDTRPTPGTGTINPVYFIHFKESAATQFRARLYITQGTDPAKFSLGLSSSSVSTGNGAIVPLGSDLSFGTPYTAIVSYTSDDDDTNALLTSDGFSSLWVNPTTGASPNITDTAPNTNIDTDDTNPMKALALRQSATSGQNGPAKIDVDTVSVGDSFNEVLTAIGGAVPSNNSDFNNDGLVDGADFLIWQKGQGLTGQTGKSNGDANGDGLVNGADLSVWQNHFGGPGAAAAVSAVPEPAAAVLVLTGWIVAMRRRS